MSLDRWISLVVLLVCLVYGYSAFFLMDDGLVPFMRHNPIWPSTFPKILSVLAGLCALAILIGFERSTSDSKSSEINYRRLTEYNLVQALLLICLMIGYALLLRPLGFLPSTFGFIVGGSAILGERKYLVMFVVGVVATGAVWYLVDRLLGIYLSPLPSFFMEVN